MADMSMPDPQVWPSCDCGIPYVLRRCYSMSKGGMTWLWQPDCKHPKKETHTHVLMTPDGQM